MIQSRVRNGQSTISNQQSRGIKVLLVEDNLGDARLMREMLAESDGSRFDLERVERLEPGLERLGQGGIDVVLLDLGLPDSQGLDTLAKARAQAPEVPIIVLTGLNDESLALRAIQAGAQDYLVKGHVDSDLLIRSIRYGMERKRAEEEMRILTVRTERMSAVGVLAAGVAHELNNPMMGMLNFAQYCLKHTSQDDCRYVVLQDMERETKRCVDIVKNLLTFSRTGKEGEEEYQKESLATVIGRVIRLLSYRIEKERVAVTQHIAEETPKIWMKVNGIQQVFLNLMSNALDALRERERREIHVELAPEGEFVQLSVSDSGKGIARENRERVFEPFFSTKPVGQGTGLGLCVSRNIINEHGGSITCESEPGAWITFKVLLPVDGRRKEAEK